MNPDWKSKGSRPVDVLKRKILVLVLRRWKNLMAKLKWAMRSNKKSGILLQLYRQMKKLETSSVLGNAKKKKVLENTEKFDKVLYWFQTNSITKAYDLFYYAEAMLLPLD